MKKLIFCVLLLSATAASAQTKSGPTNIHVSSQGTSITLTKADTVYLMNHTAQQIRDAIRAVKNGGTIRNSEIADYIKLLLKNKK